MVTGRSPTSIAAGTGTGRRLGYAAGVFDLFHIGHLNALRQARARCDILVAGVLTDDLSKTRKGVRPSVPLSERLQIVSAIRYVDIAEIEDCSKVEMWRRLRFDVIIKGDDWQGTDKGRRLESEFAPLGVDVVYVPYTPTTSSSLLRAALTAGTPGVI